MTTAGLALSDLAQPDKVPRVGFLGRERCDHAGGLDSGRCANIVNETLLRDIVAIWAP